MLRAPYFWKSFYTDVLFLAVLLIAASNYIFCKQVLVHVPPFTLLSMRYMAGVIVISFFMFPRRRHISWRMLTRSFWLGGILAIAVVSWQFGVLHTDHIGPAAFIVSLDGLMVPIFAYLLFGTELTSKLIVATSIALVGLGLLTLHRYTSVAVADIWFLVSAVAFSLHILLTHRYSRFFDSVCFSWGQLLVVWLMSLSFACLFEWHSVTINDVSQVKYQIFYLSIVATALRFPLQNFVQKRTPISKAGFLFITEPVIVSLLGFLVLSEVMSLQQILGCGIILVAVLLARGAEAAIPVAGGGINAKLPSDGLK